MTDEWVGRPPVDLYAPVQPVPVNGSVSHPYTQWREEAKRRAFRIWSPEEIWKPLEAPAYLMDGLLVKGSLALVVAYGSSLKTWVLVDAALSVATGEKWLSRFETKRGKALVIDFESGDWELRRRAHRIARGRELAIPVDGFAFVTMPSLSLADDAFYDACLPIAREYSIICIDSLAAGSGGIDENDVRFARSLQRLKALASENGCVIVLLHHSRKGSPGQETDEREMVRGSSAIFNACDVVLQLSKSKDDAFVMRQTKARGGKIVDPFVVHVDDTGPDASVVVAQDVSEESDGDVERSNRSLEKAKRAIVILLAQEHDIRGANEIYRRVTGRKRTCLDAISELEERGTIKKHAGAYRLSSEVIL